MRERDFQQQVVDLARLQGFLIYHAFDARRSEPGFPDLIMVRGGRLIAAELKVGANKPTEAQIRWLAALSDVLGVEAHLWRPEHWGEICKTLSPRRSERQQRRSA